MINVGTFNIGQGSADWRMMLSQDCKTELRDYIEEDSRYLELLQKGELSPKEIEEIKTIERNKIDELVNVEEWTAAGKLIEQNLDVICLQEVMHKDRKFLKVLELHGYEIHSGSSLGPSSGLSCSTAIAVKTATFSKIEDISIKTSSENEGPIYGKEIAACNLTVKTTGHKVSVASLHCWGFALSKDGPTELSKYDKEQRSKALNYFRQAKTLMEKQDSDAWIVAGDTNHNPENYGETFQLMENDGYTVYSPNKPTNVNRGELEYTKRKIDQIMIKTNPSSVLKKIRNFFCDFFISRKMISSTAKEATVLEDFAFKINKNCSDHKPVTIKVDLCKKKSHLSRFWSFLTRSKN